MRLSFQNILGLERKVPHGNYKEKNHNHILITDYGQEKYDLIMIIAAE